MKKLLFVFLLPAVCFGQTEKKDVSVEEVDSLYASIPKVDSQFEYTEVVVLDSTFTKNVLYKNAKLFYADLFKSAKDILQYDDKEEGKMVGKGNLNLKGSQSFLNNESLETRNIIFTIEIICKDGRYKYKIHDINADCTWNTGNTHGHPKEETLSLEQSYQKSQKGMTKKMDRSMFYNTIMGLKETIQRLKLSMAKKPSAADF